MMGKRCNSKEKKEQLDVQKKANGLKRKANISEEEPDFVSGLTCQGGDH